MEYGNVFLDAIAESDKKSCGKIGDLDIVEWCEANCILEGQYAEPGPFRASKSKYLEEPLRAIASWDSKEITILKPSQTGGTLVLDLALQWIIANRPLPLLWVCQTNDRAEHHMESRLIPSIKENKEISGYVPKDSRKLTKGGIAFPHMRFQISGPSDKKLQSASWGIVFLDETWMYGAEEDNVIQYARQRTAYFQKLGLGKIVICSQAGEFGDDTDKAWADSSQEKWNVPCLKCGELFYPDLENLNCSGKKWNDPSLGLKKSDGTYNLGKLEKLLRIECPHCHHFHSDTPGTKFKWSSNGKYKVTNPNHIEGHRGFHWSAFVQLPWIQIVKRFIQANEAAKIENYEPLKTFFQQVLARPLNVGLLHNKGRILGTEQYEPLDPQPGEVARYMGIDVQQNYFVGVIGSMSVKGDFRVLWFGQLTDITHLMEIQKKYRVPNSYVVIDTGHRTREIYSYILQYGFLGIKGMGDVSMFSHIETDKKTGEQRRFSRFFKKSETAGAASAGAYQSQQSQKCSFYLLAVDGLKDLITRLRDGKISEFVTLPPEKCEGIEEFNKQMNSEYKGTVILGRSGKQIKRWKRVSDDIRNDYWDCVVYIFGRASMNPAHKFLDVAMPSSSWIMDKTKPEAGEVKEEPAEALAA